MWRFLKKLEIELPYDPEIPLLGIYPEKTIVQKSTCNPVFIAALFTIARTWKQFKGYSSKRILKHDSFFTKGSRYFQVGPVTHPEQLNFPLKQTPQVLGELLC